MKKQSSIEWLFEQLNDKGFAGVLTDVEFHQAKEMHKQEIEDCKEKIRQFLIDEDYEILAEKI